jgi:hypothetical protein
MNRSVVVVLSWVVAIAFILGTALVYVDRLNLFATPPDLGPANMVDQRLGSADYRRAIWPVFFWTNLLFAIGFAAAVAFAWAVSSRSGVARGLPIFAALATTGGITATVASIIPIGAADASVWLGYCDCGFKETEIVSQIWAQMIAQDIGTWLNRVASIVLALGLIAFVREAPALLTSSLRTWTYLTAIALVIVPLLGIVQRTDPAAEELLSAIIGLVLVPVWAVWLGRSVDRAAVAASA